MRKPLIIFILLIATIAPVFSSPATRSIDSKAHVWSYPNARHSDGNILIEVACYNKTYGATGVKEHRWSRNIILGQNEITARKNHQYIYNMSHKRLYKCFCGMYRVDSVSQIYGNRLLE